MGLQDEWSPETPGSSGKLNNTGIIGGAGNYLNTQISKRHGMVVISYDTDALAGMTQWHMYVWDGVNITWVDTTLPVHKHSATSDGGEYFEIVVENPGTIVFNDLWPLKARWQVQVFSGTGAAIADDTTKPSVKLSTGTTSTGYARLAQGGIPITFANRMRWEGTWEISAITNILFRFGAGIEDVNAGTNNNHKLGLEWCDSQATSNYYTLSANGSSRSLVDSGVPMLAATRHGAKIVFYPATKAEYKFWNGTIYNKTGVLPNGIIDSTNVVGWGAKNNNGGVVNRDLHAYATFLSGRGDFVTFTGWPI